MGNKVIINRDEVTNYLDSPVFFNGDESKLVVIMGSSWDSGNTVLESRATLDISTGIVECFKEDVHEDVEDLDILDSEEIWIGDTVFDVCDGEIEEKALKEIRNKLQKSNIDKHGLLMLLQNGISLEIPVDGCGESAVLIPDLDINVIKIYQKGESAGTDYYFGYYDMNEDGLERIFNDADIFPYGARFNLRSSEEIESENTNKVERPRP